MTNDTEKINIEISREELDILVGSVGAFLSEHEKWIKNYNPEDNFFGGKEVGGVKQEIFFAMLSEKMTATHLLHKFAAILGWSEEEVTEYEKIIEKEVYGKES